MKRPVQTADMRFVMRGFTLIEVMIVVAIIGILAAIALPSYSHLVEKADLADARTELVKLNQLFATQKLRGNLNGTFIHTSLDDVADGVRRKYDISATCGNGATGCTGTAVKDVPQTTYFLYVTPRDGSGRQKSLWMSYSGTVYQCKNKSLAQSHNKADCEQLK